VRSARQIATFVANVAVAELSVTFACVMIGAGSLASNIDCDVVNPTRTSPRSPVIVIGRA
jgi:hypothetical protein